MPVEISGKDSGVLKLKPPAEAVFIERAVPVSEERHQLLRCVKVENASKRKVECKERSVSQRTVGSQLCAQQDIGQFFPWNKSISYVHWIPVSSSFECLLTLSGCDMNATTG